MQEVLQYLTGSTGYFEGWLFPKVVFFIPVEGEVSQEPLAAGGPDDELLLLRGDAYTSPAHHEILVPRIDGNHTVAESVQHVRRKDGEHMAETTCIAYLGIGAVVRIIGVGGASLREQYVGKMLLFGQGGKGKVAQAGLCHGTAAVQAESVPVGDVFKFNHGLVVYFLV